MTVILPFGRIFARHVGSKSNQVFTRLTSSNSILRASYINSNAPASSQACCTHLDRQSAVPTIRTYATEASSRPVGRPKAHTGRTAAKRTTTTTKSTAAKKKPVKKTKTKAKTKKKPKPKPRAKPKKTVKKPLSKNAIVVARRAKDKDLKAKALLTEPKQLPASVWLVYLNQHAAQSTGLAGRQEVVKQAAQGYKNMSPEEREQINHTTNQNKAKNEAEYKKWVSQYTPAEIKAANNARRELSKKRKIATGKKHATVHPIKDDRLVKMPPRPYALFTKERFASGDFKHMVLKEATRLIAREWKALSAQEKKPYEDQSSADTNRYIEEVRTVYGQEPKSKKISTA